VAVRAPTPSLASSAPQFQLPLTLALPAKGYTWVRNELGPLVITCYREANGHLRSWLSGLMLPCTAAQHLRLTSIPITIHIHSTFVHTEIRRTSLSYRTLNRLQDRCKLGLDNHTPCKNASQPSHVAHLKHRYQAYPPSSSALSFPFHSSSPLGSASKKSASP
jgi:hypothetical protein